MKLCTVIALAAVALLATRAHALAATEYCPAVVQDSYHFVSGNDGLESVVLSAFSERMVSGHLIFKTRSGNWYSAAFAPVNLKLDRATFRNDRAGFTRDTYVSPVLYFRIPQPADIEALWVSDAAATRNLDVDWTRRGSVSCPPSSSAIAVEAKTAPVALRSSDETVRMNSAPYDLKRPPSGSDTIAPVVSTTSPGDTSCSVPFKNAGVPTAKMPVLPEGNALNFGHYRVSIALAIDDRGHLDEAWLWESSALRRIDDATLDAARGSTYTPAVAFCKPVPSVYYFRSEMDLDPPLM